MIITYWTVFFSNCSPAKVLKQVLFVMCKNNKNALDVYLRVIILILSLHGLV